MKCPHCRAYSYVIRTYTEPRHVMRRRCCLKCGLRFKSYEFYEDSREAIVDRPYMDEDTALKSA